LELEHRTQKPFPEDASFSGQFRFENFNQPGLLSFIMCIRGKGRENAHCHPIARSKLGD
jgi:hypothetical protein